MAQTPMPGVHRIVEVMLKEYGPLCERCLARRTRMKRVAAMLDTLRKTVAVKVEHGECSVCEQWTKIFCLAKTHEDAKTVTRTSPGERRGNDELICPVCVKPIAKNERVSGRGEDLMHEACDYIHKPGRASHRPRR